MELTSTFDSDARASIAFVVKRYGDQINGGAELHCKMLAERLASDYKVEVLTTCIEDYQAYTNEYETGETQLNNVTIRRFNADMHTDSADKGRIRSCRKLRRLLFRVGILGYLYEYVQTDRDEENYLLSLKFNSSTLMNYLEKNFYRYKKVFFLTYNSPLTIKGVELCGKQSILIPTAHYESELFLPFLNKLFSLPAFIAFNSTAEKNMCQRIFGKMAPNDVVGVGILPEMVNVASVEQHNDYGDYIVYIGRVDDGKLGSLVPYFIRYIEETRRLDKLIIIGGIFTATVNHPNIVYTGFIDEVQKQFFLRNAKLLVNPSAYESLSLVVLEAFSMGIPVLVNGRCEVLNDHVRMSKAGMAYSNYWQFKSNLLKILKSTELSKGMSMAGISYFQNNYQWNVVLEKIKNAIEQ